MPRIQQHTHKLKRHRYPSTGSKVFFCVLDCGFKVDVGLALGKKTICWRCGNETTINEASIRLARPHCPGCTKSKATEVKVTVEELSQPLAVAEANSLSERLKQLTTVGPTKEDEDI